MGDPAQDFLDSGGESAHPLSVDTSAPAANDDDPGQQFLDSGGTAPHPLAEPVKPKAGGKTNWDDYWIQQAKDEAEANTGAAETVLHLATGTASTLAAGFRYATGADRHLTEEQRQKYQEATTYQPRTEAGQGVVRAVDTAGGYLGSTEGKYVGPLAADYVQSLGAGPRVAGLAGATAETLANVPQYALGILGTGKGLRAAGEAPRLTETGAPAPRASTPAAEVPPAQLAERAVTPNEPTAAKDYGIKEERAESPTDEKTTGNLTPEQQENRKALFVRAGTFKEVRTSAIEGDAQAAADDWDQSKITDDPGGKRLRGVIEAEKQGMVKDGENMVGDTQARPGMDQTARKLNGKAMAAPIDALQDHLEAATTKAYETAKAQMGDKPVTLPTLEAALKDPTLTNQMLAEGNEGFLKGAQAQLDHFKATNPEGLTVGTAEQYRQFLNTLWKKNPDAVGVLKRAIDTDVANQAGPGIFDEARQLHQLSQTLLENPKGIKQTFGKDPNTAVNRRTSYEDIPDKVLDQPSDQFNNILNTYRMMPEELQPQAQRAISVLKGHAINRLVDAGSTGADIQWNKKAVNNELADNSENLKNLFADDPKMAARIKDMKDRGEALRFNSSYRGAAAQAANLQSRGIGGKALETAGGMAGGAAGAYFGSPLMAGPGAVAGKAAVGKILDARGARAAAKATEARVTKIQ